MHPEGDKHTHTRTRTPLCVLQELKVENASLKNRLAQKTVELNKTLTEVLDMLDAGRLLIQGVGCGRVL